MRAWLSWVVALATAACGDNSYPLGEPLGPAENLAIVAHQDDDLLFMQPDLFEAVERGVGVTNVYVTAGNGHGGIELAEQRYAGLMAAYSAIAHADDWSCGWIDLAGHAVEHCRLASAHVSLVFLGYPDGGKEGMEPASLLHLWERRVQSVRTVARRETTYDQQGLITVVSEIIGYSNPATLRTLDFAATHGHDHSDHLIVGALAVVAMSRSTVQTELIAYRGYNTASEPRNYNSAMLTRELDALAHYEACVAGCAPCGSACTLDRIVPLHYEWLQHRYAFGVRRTGEGQLRLGDGCVSATAPGRAAIVDCAGAMTWRLDEYGLLRGGELCLRTLFNGEIVAGTCGGDRRGSSRFFLDDEGHLWSGIVPLPQNDMVMAHLTCVDAAGGRPRAVLCGAGHAPSWELARAMTVTQRDTTTITRTGRAVRMARMRGQDAMVCAVETGTRGLMCAPSTTGGELLRAVRIDNSTAPLAIEPESLVLGDVDGDGMLDACGRDASGLVCATAADGYQTARWSAMLGGTGPATPTDRSLSIADGKICGLGSAGVVCVSKNATAITDVRSTWPDRGAALWIADLDGDRAPDWCAATPGGPACSLSSDRRLTTDGVPWGYSERGFVEGGEVDGVPDTAGAVFTDIDGDGRDDLCSARDGAILCARSLGRGFGPRAMVARLPAGMAPTAVWAEPASGDRAPRICAADATAIACTD